MQVIDWTLNGAEEQTLFGNTHLPPDDVKPIGHLVIAHGFRGYKDYGILPVIAHEAAQVGLIAHRFNFGHSGMTNNIDLFERIDLFEKDTWNKQIADLTCVANAIASGELLSEVGKSAVSAGNIGKSVGDLASLPQVWFGHSRGGVTVLLTAGRAFSPSEYNLSATIPAPAAIIPCAAPAAACMMSEDDQKQLQSQGFLTIQSSRTKQDLRIGVEGFNEYNADPQAFDPIRAAGLIDCPMLVVHGDEDMTVPDDCAHMIANAARHATLEIVPGATHVFNTSNPAKLERDPSTQAMVLLDKVCEFSVKHSAGTS